MFHKLDLDLAMMAITAHAQWIRLRVNCALDDSSREMRSSGYHHLITCDCEGSALFNVCLWLMESLIDVAKEFNIFYKGLNDMPRPFRPTTMAVLGGSAEVSQTVALQFDANLDPEDS